MNSYLDFLNEAKPTNTTTNKPTNKPKNSTKPEKEKKRSWSDLTDEEKKTIKRNAGVGLAAGAAFITGVEALHAHKLKKKKDQLEKEINPMNEAFLEGYYAALEDFRQDYEEELGEIFMEGYCDAITEASSTARYLNHHSIGGSLFGPGLLRFLNAHLKQKNRGSFRVEKLYPKYLRYCADNGFTPLKKEEFVKEGKKYYHQKQYADLAQAGTEVIGLGGLGTIGNAVYRRSNAFDFVDDAGMRNDIPDEY